MASLPVKYDKRLRRVLGYRAVWEPGANVSLGDIVTQKNGIFTDVDRLSDWGVDFRTERRQEARLELNARGVSETIFQGGAEVPSVDSLKPSVRAELKIDFRSAHSYHLKTTELSGQDIGDLAKVGRQVAKLEEWPFRDYWIVWRILEAKSFTFLGTMSKNRSLSLSGTGRSIARYVGSGISAGLSKSSSANLDLEIIGVGGPLAIGVTRVKKNGRLRDV